MLELIMVLSALLRKYSDFAVVGARLVVNALLSFVQEHRAASVVSNATAKIVGQFRPVRLSSGSPFLPPRAAKSVARSSGSGDLLR